MEPCKYVSGESIGIAQDMEKHIAALPRTSGILFVGVEPVPVEGGKCDTFDVIIGMAKNYKPGTGHALVKYVLGTKFDLSKFTIRTSAHNGIAGSYGTSNAERADHDPS